MAIQFEKFDKTDVYNEQIEPLMRKINDLCGEHDIPCLISVVSKWDEENNSCGHGIAVTGNCRNNPIDGLHVVMSEILEDFPQKDKLIKFARATLMADIISSVISDDDSENKESDNKDKENEAE